MKIRNRFEFQIEDQVLSFVEEEDSNASEVETNQPARFNH